jgi:hypothetical protein
MKASLSKAFVGLASLCLFATSSFCQISSLRELMPPPKVAYQSPDASSPFLVQNDVRIHVPGGLANENARVVAKAVIAMNRALSTQAGLTSDVAATDYSTYVGGTNAIVLGIKGSSVWFDSLLGSCLPSGESLIESEGYLLHVGGKQLIIAGADTAGLMHGVARFAELWMSTNKYASAHILDYPDYPNRWVFSMHNLRGPNAMNVLRNISDTMYRYHYNGLQQNDFKYNLIEDQPDWYFKNADTIKRYTDERQIEMIPGVAPMGYSEGILWDNPNLAEGMPTSALYVMEADTGRLIPDPEISIINGGFENVNGSGNFTGFGFYDNENGATQADKQIKVSGTQSARTIDPQKANPSGNARFNVQVNTKPNKYYYLSAWVRTENIARGEIRLLALGFDDNTSLPLTHTAFSVPSTTDRSKNNGWVKLGVLFNSQSFSKMYLYAGIWGGSTGTIWWDDLKIEEAGLVNILRRPGTPLRIEKYRTGVNLFVEGQDYSPLHDSIMENSYAQYTYHRAPVLRRMPNGAIKNGDTLEVHYSHGFTTIQDVNGIGQNMACPSEEKTYEVIRDGVQRVKALHSDPHKYMLGHDEIRHMNWDEACASRNMSAAQILGDNVTRVANDIRTIASNSSLYAWSDMFDSLHNAVNNYYAVRGDLAGVWDLIPKDLTIINWNSSNKQKSLDFFARHGFKQMSSPYYDAQNTVNMREWRLAMQGVPGAVGAMYTTWVGDYNFLRPFSYYAWGAGPYIIHQPFDSTTFSVGATGQAVVLPDPFDAGDRIESVNVHYTLTSGSTGTASLAKGSNDTYTWTISEPLVSAYKIVAKNSQGLTRETPTYMVVGAKLSVNSAQESNLLIYPNPASSMLSIRGGEIKRVLSITGQEVLLLKASSGNIDVSALPAGSYLVEIVSDGLTTTEKFVKQ